MVCMYSRSIWLVYFYICILFCCTNRNINENILSSFCLSKYLSSKRNFLPSMLVESAAKIKMTQSLVVFRKDRHIGPTQVKCRLLISSIFDAMNFQHFSEMLEFNL